MRSRHRRYGLERAGAFPEASLPFPARRRRELKLALAWRSVAGSAIAAQAPVRGIRAGTLIVETEEARWAETLRELLPRLGIRLARRYPELGVRRCRLILRDDTGRSMETIALEAEADVEPAEPARRVSRPVATIPISEDELRRRLEQLGSRLLARAAERQKP